MPGFLAQRHVGVILAVERTPAFLAQRHVGVFLAVERTPRPP
jgi:hypothetical protein